MIIVAQRVSTIMDADQIVVLEGGALGRQRNARAIADEFGNLRRDRRIPAHRGGGSMSETSEARAAPPHAARPVRWRRDARREVDELLAVGETTARHVEAAPDRPGVRLPPHRPQCRVQRDRPEAARRGHEPHLRGRDLEEAAGRRHPGSGHRGAAGAGPEFPGRPAQRHAPDAGRRHRHPGAVQRADVGARALHRLVGVRLAAGLRAQRGRAARRSTGCARTSRRRSTGCRCGTTTRCSAESCSAASPTTSTTSPSRCSRPSARC